MRLRLEAHAALIEVDNPGSPLPLHVEGRLFESLWQSRTGQRQPAALRPGPVHRAPDRRVPRRRGLRRQSPGRRRRASPGAPRPLKGAPRSPGAARQSFAHLCRIWLFASMSLIHDIAFWLGMSTIGFQDTVGKRFFCNGCLCCCDGDAQKQWDARTDQKENSGIEAGTGKTVANLLWLSGTTQRVEGHAGLAIEAGAGAPNVSAGKM